MSGSETTTPILGLIKPPIGADDDVWGDRINTNSDTIDANAGSNNTRLTALEAAVAALQALKPVQEDVGSVKFWLGGGGTIPANWYNCDGSAVSRTTYPALFLVIGYLFGGTGDSFNLPDMRGVVAVGLDQGTNRLQGQYGADRVGGMGGVAIIALTAAQMPPHAHGGSTDAQGQHAHQFDALQASAGSGSGQFAPSSVELTGNSYPAGIHAHAVTTDSQGGGQPHSNCQPGVMGLWIIKLALVTGS